MNIVAVYEKTPMGNQPEENAPNIKSRERQQVIQFKHPVDTEKQLINLERVNTKTLPAVIKVISCGGGGGNALNLMIASDLYGVEFIAANTDVQDLYEKSLARIKVQIGAKTTNGHGAGGDPEKGEKAAIEDLDAIAEVLKDTDMLIITAGLGGGTGTGAAHVIAKKAKEMGILTVAVVTLPFEFEGRYIMNKALAGLEKLRGNVDSLIVIRNQHLFNFLEKMPSYKASFKKADEVLCKGVRAVSDIINKVGYKNIDFADVQSVMRGKGDTILGIGMGTGENRAMDAIIDALEGPLHENTSIEGATNVLINIAGPEEILLSEINQIINAIKDKCHPNVNIIHGLREAPEFGDSIQVTIIATGFQEALYAAPVINQTVKSKPKPPDFIEYNDFIKMKDRGKIDIPFLPQREYHDDLDVPAVIRNHDYQADERENLKKAENE